MAYGDPQFITAGSVAAIAVQDITGTGEYPPQLELTTGQFGSGEATVEEAEALFQKILSAVEAHPDLTVVDARRTYPTSQVVTP